MYIKRIPIVPICANIIQESFEYLDRDIDRHNLFSP